MFLLGWAQGQQSSSIPGSVPTVIRFSGNLADSTGRPLSGVVGVTFSLFADQQGGAPLWVETQNVQADKSGHYAVTLGSTTSLGLPLTLFASAQARWLGVQAQGLAELPRVLLASVPYALKALDAETLGGKRPSDFVFAPSSTAESAAGPLPIARNTKIDQPLTVTGKGTPQYIPLWTSVSNLTSSVIYQAPGNHYVGIGTTSPQSQLVVDATGTAVTGIARATTGTTFGRSGFSHSSSGAGVAGNATSSSGNTAGVSGNSDSTAGAGVFGRATSSSGNSIGVLGLSSSTSGRGVRGDATSTTGAAYGVTGNAASTSGIGVLGVASATTGASSGVHGTTASASGYGVAGLATSTSGSAVGVGGTADSLEGVGVYGVGVAASNQGTTIRPIGVWGDTDQDGAGVVGTADNAVAVAGSNNGSNNSTALFRNDEGTRIDAGVVVAHGTQYNGLCIMDVSGNLACNGSKSAVVPVDGGTRQLALYAVEAPENWFEDAGSGRLSSGSAVVHLESSFAQTVNSAVAYHVFLTPEGDCNGLYVANKTAASFEVRELGGGTASIDFDYRIMARRKGYEHIRLADKTELWNELAKQTTSMPARRPLPVKPPAVEKAAPVSPVAIGANHDVQTP